MFAYPDINTRGTGRILDRFCKPSTSSRVCITVSNSPNPSRVYIRLLKHGKRFLLLKCHLNAINALANSTTFRGLGGGGGYLFPCSLPELPYVRTLPHVFLICSPFNKFTYHLSPHSTATVITIYYRYYNSRHYYKSRQNRGP